MYGLSDKTLYFPQLLLQLNILILRIQLKQNLLDVALLTNGDIKHWDPKAVPIRDPRAHTIQLGAYFTEGMGMNGMSIVAKDLLADLSLIKFVKSRNNQNVYIWGSQLNSLDVINKLKANGADGLIFDKLVK